MTIAVEVDPNNPEAIPRPARAPDEVPFEPHWDEALGAGGLDAIMQKAEQVAASFGQPPAPQQQARAMSFDPREDAAWTPKSYEGLVQLAYERASGKVWKIDVNRDAPRDIRYRGLLGSYEEMSNDDFAKRFGGGEYTCTLLIERSLPSGHVGLRPDKTAKFSIPGNPVPIAIQRPEHEAGPAPGPSGYGGPSTQVDLIHAKASVDRESMLLNRVLDGGRGTGGGEAKYLASFSEKTLEAQAEQAGRMVEVLQRQLADQQQEVHRMRDENRRIQKEADERDNEYRKRSIDEQHAMALRLKEARDEAERSAAVLFESRIAARESELRMERSEKDRVLGAERELMQRRIEMVEAQRTSEIERLRNENERALDREKADRQREVDQVKAGYEARLTSATRDNLRDQGSTSQLSQMLVTVKDSEIAKLTTELAALRIENDDLKKKVYKDIGQHVKEIATIAPLLGWKHASEAEEAEPAAAAAEPPKSLIEQMVAGAPGFFQAIAPLAGPAVARMMSGNAPAAPPAPAPRPLPQGPVVQQVQAPQQRPSNGRSTPVVVGGRTPPNVSTVIAPPRRPAQPAVPPPPPAGSVPEAVTVEPVGAPERFRARGPQPASPAEIESLLGLVTEQAKGALAAGSSPADAAAQIKSLDASLAAAYVGWVDAENALVLLERTDGIFWGGEDAREWFHGFWGALGEP